MILTALSVEFEAVRPHVVDVTVQPHSAGTLFDVGHLECQPNCQVALATIGVGGLTTATLTERAITEFRPSAVLFVGIAGGLREWLELGDVIAATKVYAYDGGRSEDEEFLARPRAWETSHAIDQVARRLPRGNRWHALLPSEGEAVTPSVHFEAIAAGDVLLNSTKSPLRQQLRRNYNDAVAVEMESAGLALAGHLNGGVPAATIRGISDLADGHKAAADRGGSQRIAARNAAAFAVTLAGELDRQLDQGPKGSPPQATSRPHLPQIRNTNTARDNARVGQQIGVHMGALQDGAAK
ncbi:5'-methylthioadenosine/S-adenosylhomocysteine nucleosidase [Actinophytocola oryzae]|uniref:5'-methylthioadenosine/S-adenosylhomocysteine nucleosidase family protein n=1 Tax=Actinophytocola oryzae TaxID=502181 RepID=UPI001FB9353E|nr:5'-methylthioadenosine/S-adenosylhomocysteine nucleosidase [Actinophytocola oryzae]